jgi:hypothetical protein
VALKRGVPPETPFDAMEARGQGADCFYRLRDPNGRILTHFGADQWTRDDETTAALATHGRSPLDGTPTITIKESQMQMRSETANAEFLELTKQIQREKNIPWNDAARLAGETPRGRELWEEGRPVEPGATVLKTPIPASFNLSADLEARAENGATFFELCQQYAQEKHCEFRHAVHVLGQRFPELAAAR